MEIIIIDLATKIGIILGTGTNGCYLEKCSNIKKINWPDQEELMVINMEWGGYGSNKSGLLPMTRFDYALDEKSTNPKQQWFEKMISGFYLGEICRLILLDLHARKEIWAGTKTLKPSVVNDLSSKDISDVESDVSSELNFVVSVVEERVFGVTNSTMKDRLLFQSVCILVVERAARLSACAIAATVLQIMSYDGGADYMTVAVDGSVYENHYSMRKRLENALSLLGCRVKLVLSKDGSGKGAALIAAASSF